MFDVVIILSEMFNIGNRPVTSFKDSRNHPQGQVALGQEDVHFKLA